MNLTMGFSSFWTSKRSRRQANENLSIQLFNKDRDGERYKIEAGETAENVCQAIGIKLGITPTLLNCFALKKCFKSGDCVWLSPHKEMCIQTEPVDLHFRMRFIPTSWASDGSKSKLFEDFSCVRYLFWQLHWDFLHDAIDYFKRKENAERARGLVVLLVLIHMRIDTELRQKNGQTHVEESLDAFLKNTCMKFSSYLPETLKKAFLDGFVLKSNMKRKVLEYQQACPADNSCYNAIALMKSFIRNVLQNDRNIFCEVHHALRVNFDTNPVSGVPHELERKYTGREEISIIVDLGRSPAALFIDRGKEKKGILIQSLCGSEIKHDRVKIENGQEVDFHTVQLSREDGPPETFYFEELIRAESFVTCIETYYRLTTNFYQSICRPLQPRKVKDINDVKCFGPITEDSLKAKLEKQYGVNSDVYTLRKSLTDHDVFEVVRPVKGSSKLRVVSLGKLTLSEGKYSFDSHPPTSDLKKLMHDRVSQVEGLNPTNCHKVVPKFEACDIIRELFEKHDSKKIDDEDEEEELRRIERENQPKVMMGSSIKVLSCIGKGYFTEVYQGFLKDGENVIVKRLRERDIIDKLDRLGRNHTELFSKLKKALNNGFNKLLELNDPKYFLGFMGIALTDPQAMLLKAEKYGNLSYFLATQNRYDCQLTMHHLQAVAIQLSDALGYMEEKNCFHGNLHCGNIIVTKFLPREMLVKITDPGIVEFYNQLGLDTVCNRNRLPWIAPELYEDLEAVTVRSEVYAYGMTLWQMFHEGQSPMSLSQFMSLDSSELCQKFTQEKFPLPCPLYLTQNSCDSKEIKAIKGKMFDTIRGCCSLNEEERPCPREIIRKLRENIQCYEQYYHDYNIIYESSENFSIHCSGQTSPGSDDTSGVMTNCHPVQVPIQDLLKLNSGDRAEETSPKVRMNSRSRDENTHPKSLLNVECNDENTTPKWSNVGPNGQSFICPIEPGFMLKEAEKLTAPCPDHPALFNNHQNITTDMEPIVTDVKFIITEGRLTIDTNISLGSGHYGNIYKGKLEPNSSSGFNEAINVAVKALKDDQAERFASEFRKEAQIMEKLDHANIVKFYGIYRGGKYMVMELVDKGSLLQFVVGCKRESRPITDERKLQISIDITSGMEYLQSQHIIHCDLAARNVLLTSEYRAKVSDFGLSKILCHDKDYYRRKDNKTIPILWCAPEWIGFKKYSSESDVWSFGVVLWEIYSYGKLPIIARDKDLNHFYQDLFEGKRLAKPRHCSDEIYSIMKSCWTWEATTRQSFSNLKQSLQTVLDRLQVNRHSPAAKNNQSKPDSSSNNDSSVNKTGSNTSTTNNTTNQTDRSKNKMGSDISRTNNTKKQNNQNSDIENGRRSNGGEEERSQVDVDQRSNQNSDLITEETSSQDLYGKVNGTNFVDLVPAKEVSDQSSKVKIKRVGEVSTNASKTEPPRAVDPLLKNQIINNTDNSMTFRKSPRSNNSGLFIEEGLVVDRSKTIGQGHFGKVYQGTYCGSDVAIKTCHNEEYLARFKREYELLLDLDHPNIVKLFGIHSPNGNGSDIEYVMEYCSRESLYQHLVQSKHKNDPVQRRQKIQFLIHIAEGMNYLFSKSIIHADLKADNILLNEDYVAKLSDFGLAKKLEGEEINYQYRRENGVLKIEKCSPEHLNGILNRFSDIWSFGVMCLEVFDDGIQPNFESPVDFGEAIRTSNCTKLFMKIQNGERYCKPSECPKQLYDVIYRCWDAIPRNRVSYTELLEAFRLYLEDSSP